MAEKRGDFHFMFDTKGPHGVISNAIQLDVGRPGEKTAQRCWGGRFVPSYETKMVPNKFPFRRTKMVLVQSAH